ncbi:hypothetical protein ACTQ05_07785 [Collinsella sp. LCP21S3_A9]|uniref:hypothetical protein n=1 Tax=Collinsella sp. LCP21S3_A9 TaxID=3438770 RepID=UPI003F8F5B1E
MINETCSATPLDAVLIEPRPSGILSDVWLRKNIQKDVADNGIDSGNAIEFYRADEIHFVQAGVPTIDGITAAFDELWAAHEDDGLSDTERIEKIIESLTATKAALEDTNAALLEIGDIVGGAE